VIAKKPKISNGPKTPGQIAVRTKFKEARDYAVTMIAIPEFLEFYKSKAKPGRSAYTAAFADYMHLPWISAIDTAQYDGEIGNVIRVAAFDDYRVVKVMLEIKDQSGSVMEKGLCQKDPEGNLWLYTATVHIPLLTGCTLIATVFDLPNHSSTFTITM